MRKIYFRGKRISDGEWLYGYFIRNKDGCYICIIDFAYIDDAGALSYKVFPDSVGQFTGFCDKFGREIFEGDIVEFEAHGYIPMKFKGNVVFKDGCFSIEYSFFGNSLSYHQIGIVGEWRDMGASGTVTYTYEVVGNSFDK